MEEPNNGTGTLPTLVEIEEDLSTIETDLENVNNLRGRAIFSSVSTMLGSLRRRLEALNNPGGLGNNEDASRLSERLQTAQMAHSNRIPLNLLRSTRGSEELRASHRSALMVTARMSLSERDDNKDSAEPKPSSSRLVASRRKLENLENADRELHTSAFLAPELSPVSEQSDQREDASDDSNRPQDDGLQQTVLSTETPLLLSKVSMQSLRRLSSRNISGSIVLEPQKTTTRDECSVYSWGSSHLLHDDDEERLVPEKSLISTSERIGRLTDIVSVACGPNHAACATKQGQVFTCGDNTSGAVSPFERDQKMIVRPQVGEFLGTQTIIRQVSCGWDHTAAVTSTGVVLTWGNNEKGQLGRFISPKNKDVQTVFCKPQAMAISAEYRVTSVACGDQFTMVLTTRMTMMICGKDELAGNRKVPKQLPLLVGLPIAYVAAGKDHAVVLTVFGTAYAWGDNSSGCCGRPFPKVLPSPVPMVTPSAQQIETSLGKVNVPQSQGSTSIVADEVATIHAACGNSHTVLVTRSGRLLVCGSNDNGQLGIRVEKSLLVERLKAVDHPVSGRRFLSTEAGENSTLLLDDCGDVWQAQGGNLSRVLDGKHILTIAAGGKQCIAMSHGDGARSHFHMTEEIEAVSHTAENLESLIKQLSEEALETSITASGQKLVNQLEELLKNPSVLNSLFVDLSELDHLYGEITAIQNPKLQEAIALATEKSIFAGLQSLQSANASMKYAGSVRCLLHYVRFFDDIGKYSSEFDPRCTLIASLCEMILDLPFEGFKNMLAWIDQYPRQLFVRMLVRPLLFQLNKSLQVEVDDDGGQHLNVCARAAPLIGAVLRWLHAASERASLASPQDFYCDAIAKIPLETLYEDLQNKKLATNNQIRQGFLISQNPFLIPPTTKRDILRIESQVNMMKTASQDPSTVNIEEGTMTINPFFTVKIDREHLLEQTLEAIVKARPEQLRKKLRIEFKDEEGVDAGGVTKEFFLLVSEEVFDVHSALWSRRFGDQITWFNSDNTWDEKGYEQVGMLVGLALYNDVNLDVHFPQAVYRLLLNKPLGMEDLFDEDLKNGLQQLLDYEGDDVEDVFCLTFEVSWMDLGKEHKIELKPDGANIEVTQDNKEEYVMLYVKWILVDSIRPQWEAFRKGVNVIMEGSSLGDLFTPQELELLVVGDPELDFCALESKTEYEGGYDKESPVVRNLWKFVKNADHETQMHFLKFTTGTTKAPIGGLGAINFKVQRAGPDSQLLPTSHTCFNTLMVPDYGDDYQKLEERLGRAILECEGFGLM